MTGSQIFIPDAENAIFDSKGSRLSDDVDVSVVLGDVPAGWADDFGTVRLTDDWYYLASPGRFLMYCQGYRFDISGGTRVIVDLNGLPIENSHLHTYILGSAFGVICLQRDLLPIHGAAIETDQGSAIIITGYTGSGKSAILSALVDQGRRYLSDDVTVIAIKAGAPVALPAYPQRKIAARTVEERGVSLTGAIPIHEDGRDKFAIRNTAEWAEDALPLAAMVELRPVKREGEPFFIPEVKRITGHASLNLLMRNLYRRRFWESIGVPPERMKQLLEITAAISVYQVIRPSTGFPVDDTALLIAEKCFI